MLLWLLLLFYDLRLRSKRERASVHILTTEKRCVLFASIRTCVNFMSNRLLCASARALGQWHAVNRLIIRFSLSRTTHSNMCKHNLLSVYSQTFFFLFGLQNQIDAVEILIHFFFQIFYFHLVYLIHVHETDEFTFRSHIIPNKRFPLFMLLLFFFFFSVAQTNMRTCFDQFKSNRQLQIWDFFFSNLYAM